MFIFRPSRGGQVSKKVLMAIVDLFNNGRWDELVEMSVTSFLDAARAQARRLGGAHEDNVEKRARSSWVRRCRQEDRHLREQVWRQVMTGLGRF